MKHLCWITVVVTAIFLALSSAGPASAAVSTSGGGWVWMNPLVQGNWLNSVDFVDAQHGWTAGDYGTMLRTADGGTTWSAQLIPTTEPILSVCFTDELHGWATTAHAVIATPDGGQTWRRQLSLSPSDVNSFLAIDFGSATSGIVSGFGGLVYRTTDGGNHWAKAATGITGALYDVDMADASNGWAVGDYYDSLVPAVLHTTDGGATWSPQGPGFSQGRVWSVDAVDAQTAVFCGVVTAAGDRQVVSRTVNAGTNWSETAYVGLAACAAFSSAAHGWVYDGTTTRETNDGGQTWSLGQSLEARWNGNYRDVLVSVDADHVYLAGMSVSHFTPAVYASEDGGDTWSHAGSGWKTGAFFGLSFPTATDGWVTANIGEYYGSDPQSFDLLHTSDGGLTWQGRNLPDAFFNPQDVTFADATSGWVVGYGSIAGTQDGGATWTMQQVGPDAWRGQLWRIDSVDATHAWIAGDDGHLYRTTDGGGFWAPATLASSLQVDFHDVDFVDALHGCAVGEMGRVLTSGDGGVTWRYRACRPLSGQTARATSWTDATHGWVAGDESKLAKTSDGGATWTAQSSGPVAADWRAIRFSDSMHGWLAGKLRPGGGAVVMRTSDGGKTWKLQSLGYRGDAAFDIEAIDADHAVACGDSFVMGTSTGGVSPVESAAPSISVAKAAGVWHNHDVAVTVKGSDAGSGVKAYSTSFDGRDTIEVSSFVVERSRGEGLHILRTAVLDAAGNVSGTVTTQIGIDTRKPTKSLPLNHPSVSRGGTVTLKYRITDPTPGCGKVKATLLIGTRARLVKKMSIGTVATNKTISYRYRCGLGSGTYFWLVTAKDIAGNAIATKNIWAWTLTAR